MTRDDDLQAEILEKMAKEINLLVKDEINNSLFRAGVEVAIAKLKTKAFMLRELGSDYLENQAYTTEHDPLD